MPAPVNRLKARLAAGEVTFGLWLATGEPLVAEIAGTAGFDWLTVDGEHGPNDLPSIVRQLQVLAASASETVVRLPVDEVWMIKQVLDAGAQSIVIPMVESREQAEALVAATRYPPAGRRGIGSAIARASRFNRISDYLDTADDQICIIAQIETARAVDNLDEILGVEGIDCFFIGPADLAADLGHRGQSNIDAVQEVIADTIGRIRGAGRAAGILSLSDEEIERDLGYGATMVGVGVDVLLLAGAMRDLAARYIGSR